MIEEELASVLKRTNQKTNSLTAILRSLWDGESLRSMIKNSPDTATEPHGSIIAHCTKEELSALLADTDLVNGFANRFLWIYTERSKSLPDAGLIPSVKFAGEIKALQRSIESATDGEERELKFNQAAAEMWRGVYFDLSEGEAEISKASLEAALALWSYSATTARWLFGTPFNHPDADRLYKALRSKRMPRTEINKAVFQGHRKSNEIAEALEILGRAGAVYCERIKTGGADVEIWGVTGAAE